MSEPHSENKGRSFAAVYVGLALLLVLAAGGFIFAYFKLVHYQRAALYHVPVGSAVAARLDFQQLVLFEPVRRHLFPLADKLGPEDAEPALERFERHTGIDLAMDLREAVLAIHPDGQWSVAVGGVFPEDGVIEGIAAMLTEDQVQGCRLEPQRLVCQQPSLWVAQAEDRVVVLASTEQQLTRAQVRSEGYEKLGMPEQAAGSLAMSAEVFAPLLQNPIAALTPGVPVLRSIARINAELVLEERALVEFQLTPTEGQSATALAPAVQQLLEGLRLLSKIPGTPQMFGGELLARAEVVPGENGLVVRSYYTPEELDRAARDAARWLDRALPN